MGDTTKCVYQFIYDENYSDKTKIIQYFIMHGPVLCIKVDSYVAHMFYEWSFSNNKEFPIFIDKKEYFIFLNTNTTIFHWGDGNVIPIKIERNS